MLIPTLFNETTQVEDINGISIFVSTNINWYIFKRVRSYDGFSRQIVIYHLIYVQILLFFVEIFYDFILLKSWKDISSKISMTTIDLLKTRRRSSMKPNIKRKTEWDNLKFKNTYKNAVRTKTTCAATPTVSLLFTWIGH